MIFFFQNFLKFFKKIYYEFLPLIPTWSNLNSTLTLKQALQVHVFVFVTYFVTSTFRFAETSAAKSAKNFIFQKLFKLNSNFSFFNFSRVILVDRKFRMVWRNVRGAYLCARTNWWWWRSVLLREYSDSATVTNSDGKFDLSDNFLICSEKS